MGVTTGRRGGRLPPFPRPSPSEAGSPERPEFEFEEAEEDGAELAAGEIVEPRLAGDLPGVPDEEIAGIGRRLPPTEGAPPVAPPTAICGGTATGSIGVMSGRLPGEEREELPWLEPLVPVNEFEFPLETGVPPPTPPPMEAAGIDAGGRGWSWGSDKMEPGVPAEPD